jgi:hypothetical protein
MDTLFTLLQTILCCGVSVTLIVGIPAAMIFGCPPSGVPFKGYYSR